MRTKQYSDEVISIALSPALLLDVERMRQQLSKRRGCGFLSRSAVIREALGCWLEIAKQKLTTPDEGRKVHENE